VPLQKVLERLVVNHIGLTGLYDFVLTFDPQAQTCTSMPQMNAAHVTEAYRTNDEADERRKNKCERPTMWIADCTEQ